MEDDEEEILRSSTSGCRQPASRLPLCQLLGLSNPSSIPPLPLGHGWNLVGGHCRPVRHTRPALPMHIHAPVPVEVNKEEIEEVEYDIYT